jgi:hypothetical protein
VDNESNEKDDWTAHGARVCLFGEVISSGVEECVTESAVKHNLLFSLAYE